MNLHRASRAKEILDNEVWHEAFTAVETSIIANWSIETDWRMREAQWERLQALRDVRAQLETFVAHGTLRK